MVLGLNPEWQRALELDSLLERAQYEETNPEKELSQMRGEVAANT